MGLDPNVTILTDENALRAFLESDQPGLVISQGTNIKEAAAALLPTQPTYMEDRRTWVSPEKHQKKLKAWLINPDRSLIAMESEEASSAK
ncbi:MAG TPA: hypothetical protein VMW72_09115 [Sedimentisphaerales bacterium]|nr:hypothetical protein [Sedimentisphaerales bacterium]